MQDSSSDRGDGSGGVVRSPHLTRGGLLGMAALTVVVVAVSLIAGNRQPPLSPQPAPTPTPPITEIVSDDLAAWDVTGPGTLTATAQGDQTVWTAEGRGLAVGPEPVGDLILDVEFQFPERRVNAGVVTRIPNNDVARGVEVTLDADANGSARVGHVAGLVSPLVYVQPRPGDWHALRVSVLGERVLVDVDGQHIADWLDMAGGTGRMAANGHVALRFSDGVRFRRMRLAEVIPPE